jgi:hypothetical protein
MGKSFLCRPGPTKSCRANDDVNVIFNLSECRVRFIYVPYLIYSNTREFSKMLVTVKTVK